jgi:hypothetical protein
MTTNKALAKTLKNIGPVMAQRLMDAGIESRDQLIEMGAVEAYLAMYPNGDNYGDHNAAYIIALEGAIQDCNWQALEESTKQTLKTVAHQLQNMQR